MSKDDFLFFIGLLFSYLAGFSFLWNLVNKNAFWVAGIVFWVVSLGCIGLAVISFIQKEV
jgi:hypothetical protein